MKVSIKSSYFRIKSRLSFVVYGKNGMFVKETKDKQESDLKKFYMPTNEEFGLYSPEDYGVLTYIDDEGKYHEEKVVSEKGDYNLFYQALYDTLVNGKEKLVKDEETIKQIEMLEEGIRQMGKYV